MEALEVEDVSLDEVLLHLVELVAADGVDIATLQLLLEDLRDRDLRQVGTHTQEVPVEHEGVFVVLHLSGELSLILLLGGELLRGRRVEISVGTSAHVFVSIYYKIIAFNYYKVFNII